MTVTGGESLGLVKVKVEIKLPKVVKKGGSISDGCNAAADWSLCSAKFHAHPQAVLNRIGPKIFL